MDLEVIARKRRDAGKSLVLGAIVIAILAIIFNLSAPAQPLTIIIQAVIIFGPPLVFAALLRANVPVERFALAIAILALIAAAGGIVAETVEHGAIGINVFIDTILLFGFTVFILGPLSIDIKEEEDRPEIRKEW